MNKCQIDFHWYSKLIRNGCLYSELQWYTAVHWSKFKLGIILYTSCPSWRKNSYICQHGLLSWKAIQGGSCTQGWFTELLCYFQSFLLLGTSDQTCNMLTLLRQTQQSFRSTLSNSPSTIPVRLFPPVSETGFTLPSFSQQTKRVCQIKCLSAQSWGSGIQSTAINFE